MFKGKWCFGDKAILPAGPCSPWGLGPSLVDTRQQNLPSTPRPGVSWPLVGSAQGTEEP